MTDLFSKSLGYVLTSASKSKTFDTAKEEVFSAFWAWVRPLFIYDVPDIETNGEDPATKQKAENRLKTLFQNEEFKSEFLQRISELEQKVVTEKNIAEKGFDGGEKNKNRRYYCQSH